jgi:hypothetical protein
LLQRRETYTPCEGMLGCLLLGEEGMLGCLLLGEEGMLDAAG